MGRALLALRGRRERCLPRTPNTAGVNRRGVNPGPCRTGDDVARPEERTPRTNRARGSTASPVHVSTFDPLPRKRRSHGHAPSPTRSLRDPRRQRPPAGTRRPSFPPLDASAESIRRPALHRSSATTDTPPSRRPSQPGRALCVGLCPAGRRVGADPTGHCPRAPWCAADAARSPCRARILRRARCKLACPKVGADLARHGHSRHGGRE